MNMRSFFVALFLTLSTVMLVGAICATASAAITNTKDSVNFNVKNWEGDAAPSPLIYGVNLDDWSFGGGNYTVVQDSIDTGATGSNNGFTHGTGWTIEWRMRTDPNDLPTALVLDANDVILNAGRGTMTFQLGDGQDTIGRWTEITMGQVGGTESANLATDRIHETRGTCFAWHCCVG